MHGCIAYSGWWEFMVTDQFICTPQQVKDGAKYSPVGQPVAPRRPASALARVNDGRLTARLAEVSPPMGMPITDSDQPDIITASGRDGRPAARGAGIPATAIAWAAPFALVLAVLLVRNAFLFSTPEYEDADMGANSILIEQARRFTLLVGHYSRDHFNEPGPAFLYLQAGASRCSTTRCTSSRRRGTGS